MENTDELDSILEPVKTHEKYTESGRNGDRTKYTIEGTDSYIFLDSTPEGTAHGTLDAPTEIKGEPVAETEAAIVEENMTEYLEPVKDTETGLIAGIQVSEDYDQTEWEETVDTIAEIADEVNTYHEQLLQTATQH